MKVTVLHIASIRPELAEVAHFARAVLAYLFPSRRFVVWQRDCESYPTLAEEVLR